MVVRRWFPAATTVTVNPTPATPHNYGCGPTTFCAGGSVTLTSSAASLKRHEKRTKTPDNFVIYPLNTQNLN
jgi:hypothetical protein